MRPAMTLSPVHIDALMRASAPREEEELPPTRRNPDTEPPTTRNPDRTEQYVRRMNDWPEFVKRST
jgi:hypothetical protein